jgi:hypothetical protein
VAAVLRRALATLVTDRTPRRRGARVRFDIELLAERLVAATD